MRTKVSTAWMAASGTTQPTTMRAIDGGSAAITCHSDDGLSVMLRMRWIRPELAAGAGIAAAPGAAKPGFGGTYACAGGT